MLSLLLLVLWWLSSVSLVSALACGLAAVRRQKGPDEQDIGDITQQSTLTCCFFRGVRNHNYKQHDVRKGRQPLHKRRTGNGISGLQTLANKVLVVVMWTFCFFRNGRKGSAYHSINCFWQARSHRPSLSVLLHWVCPPQPQTARCAQRKAATP